MIKTISLTALVLLSVSLLTGCATQVAEPDIDHKADSTSTSHGEERSFDPCKLNNKLPVCNESN